MSGIIGTNLLAQVGFIVRDIEATKKKFAAFFGVAVPENVDSGDYEVTKAEYKGNPAPYSKCQMAFFNVGEGIRIELIQPNEEPSTWKEFLDEHGEGVHHLAFRVKGMQKSIDACKEFGMTLVQRGEYNTGKGRYAYMDASDSLKVILELLEND
jgi:methylmalonyl-CoA/ethylmalonyl-CoA epimerase